jgi:hypothetical protein
MSLSVFRKIRDILYAKHHFEFPRSVTLDYQSVTLTRRALVVGLSDIVAQPSVCGRRLHWASAFD